VAQMEGCYHGFFLVLGAASNSGCAISLRRAERGRMVCLFMFAVRPEEVEFDP